MKKISLIGILAALLCVSMASAATVDVIAVTNNSYQSNLGGLAGADQKCVDFATANGLNNPSGWKALIGESTRDNTQPGWVLQANTPYYMLDGTTLIDTTNSNKCFTFDLDNIISTGDVVWTGLNDDCSSSGADCTSWTTNDPGDPEEESFEGTFGHANLIGPGALNGGSQSCGQIELLYCVGTVDVQQQSGDAVPEAGNSQIIALIAIVAIAAIIGVVLFKKK